MSHSRGVRSWSVAVIALAMLAVGEASASAGAAGVRGLAATLESSQSFFADGESAVVRLTLANDSAQDLYVLRWQTPLKGIEGNLFDVRVNGEPVAYTGRLYKRGAPRAEDYVRIPAGRTVSTAVDLSRYYDMTRTGEYTVRYQAAVQDALSGVDTKIADVRGLRQVASNEVAFGVERGARGRFLQEIAQSADAEIAGGAKSLTPSFVSCSSSRQSSLRTALTNAESISLKARNYLSNLPTAQRSTDSAYRTWFGSYTSSRYSTVQSHYNNIYSTFNTKTVTFYCDCNDSSYAYVFANQPYRIHLCGAFWAAPSLGIDSKAGTLVHETSHFSVVAGTQDYAYGTSACQSLANSNPSRAISNADSHEYFAETR